MSLEKLESIPAEKSEALETYLNRASASGTNYIRLPVVASEVNIDEHTAQNVLTYLCNEDILQAKLKVRCPNCGSQHGGVFSQQSEVPDKIVNCMCGERFNLNDRQYWEVVYEISEQDSDFFLNLNDRLKYFEESACDLSAKYFQNEFENLQEVDNPQERGRLFDFFVGLLFHQIPGVSVQVKDPRSEGEVDVTVTCVDADDWLFRTVGNATIVENKWQDGGATQEDVNAFRTKSKEIAGTTLCRITYFISIEGYTTDADESLQGMENPSSIGFGIEEIVDMIEVGTPERVIRENIT